MSSDSNAKHEIRSAPIGRILIANRGEIACRIIRTARALGIQTVAVHSEADARAPHVSMADEAVLIGPPPVKESYLSAEKLIDAAKKTGADAVHPGYGFLSENAGFAQACADAGLVFVGPPPRAIELMGNKAEAKRRMIEAGVPCVPGYEGRDQSDAQFESAADRIGYPVMVKAAAGGGGRGMRLVASKEGLLSALAMARSEAENAFGSGELILEKAVVRPRHVEIQVFADQHGHVIHLGERDCSVQRRHQKVIEEAPCPVMTEALREKMGRAAVEAARSIGYVGAGTVEFLLDEGGQFYFLEMNTRLQVEHPVTEIVTGLDLVALQIRVAEGHLLPLEQKDVTLSGHAMEVRLYAEDPAQGFLPSTGLVERWQPAQGEGVRVDDGIRTGQEVTPFYDAMVAKVIGYGPTRDAARRRLIAALEATALFGPKTNRRFLIDCLRNESFARRGATTAFIDEELGKEAMAEAPPTQHQASAVAVLLYATQCEEAFSRSVGVSPALRNWSSSGSLYTDFRLGVGDTRFDLRVTPVSAASYRVKHGKDETTVELIERAEGVALLRVGDSRVRVLYQVSSQGSLWASFEGRTFLFGDLLALVSREEKAGGDGRVTAPMHGVVREVFVAVGDAVKVGTKLAVMEAMKMQLELQSTVEGVVSEVRARAGQQAASGAVLFSIDARPSPATG